jgi:opacity protein-like surface antigen
MVARTLVAFALLIPSFALAAPSSAPAPRPVTTRPGARPASAPVSKQAVATPAGAQGAPAAAPWVGAFVGYETDDFAGLSLRVDGELPIRALTPRIALSLVGSLGYSRLAWDPGYDVKATANAVKVVPAARLTVPVAARVSLFGDVGLGLAWVAAKIDFPPTANANGLADVNSSTSNVMMRLGVGGWYQVSEPVKIGVLLELDPIFGDFGFKSSNVVTGGSQSTFLAQAGVSVRL